MSNEKIFAPFTTIQIQNLLEWQASPFVHPFTCGVQDCNAEEKRLLPYPEGWVCPCGKYKQDWAHAFMAKPGVINKLQSDLSTILKRKPHQGTGEVINGEE